MKITKKNPQEKKMKNENEHKNFQREKKKKTKNISSGKKGKITQKIAALARGPYIARGRVWHARDCHLVAS